MGIRLGFRLAFVRGEEKWFAVGVEPTTTIGYKQCVPLLHSGYELQSEGEHCHSCPVVDDLQEVKEILEGSGTRPFGLTSHGLLRRPEIGVSCMQQTTCFAAVVGASVINSD